MSWFKKIFGDSFSNPSAVSRDIVKPDVELEKPKSYDVVEREIVLKISDITLQYKKSGDDDIHTEQLSIIELEPDNFEITKDEFKKHFPNEFELYEDAEYLFGSYENERHESGLYSTFKVNTIYPYNSDYAPCFRKFDYSIMEEFTREVSDFKSGDKIKRLSYYPFSGMGVFHHSRKLWTEYYKDTPENRKMLEDKK